MRYALATFVLAAAAWGQPAPTPAGKWISILTFFDNTNYDRMELNLKGDTLTGKIGNNVFDGTFRDGRIEGTVKLNPRTTAKVD